MDNELKLLRLEDELKLDQYNQPKMLQSYRQNLLNARRIARYKIRMRLAEGLEPGDPDPGHKRRQFATQIAQELYDNLLFYPDSNPVVEEIRRELSEVLGKKVEFTYPPGSMLRIAVRENGALRPLDEAEQIKARETLKKVTDAQVDKGLVKHTPGVDIRG